MSTIETGVNLAIEDLVYRHAEPEDRVRQSHRVYRALHEIVRERIRQEEIGDRKRAEGIDWRSCADPLMAGGDYVRASVLGEEVGEVHRAVLELGDGTALERWLHLRAELVQVAAVAVAILESIDERAGR